MATRAMFEKMLDNPLKCGRVSISRCAQRGRGRSHRLLRPDRRILISAGKLPYRSLTFDHQTIDQSNISRSGRSIFRPPRCPTPGSASKHLTGQQAPQTTITYEYPSAGRPFIIQSRARTRLFKRWGLADETEGVTCRAAGDLPLLQHGPDRRQALATFRRIRKAGPKQRLPLPLGDRIAQRLSAAPWRIPISIQS
jgi:UDP-galactopyranose mutase